MLEFRCKHCGLLFSDPHADGVGGLAPAECPRCGEEREIEAISQEEAK